jgi:hypothetical protein
MVVLFQSLNNNVHPLFQSYHVIWGLQSNSEVHCSCEKNLENPILVLVLKFERRKSQF